MTRCTAIIKNGSYQKTQCSRNAVIEVDGEFYCRQHSPAEKEKRRQEAEKKSARYAKTFMKAAAHHDLASTYIKYRKGIATQSDLYAAYEKWVST